MVNLRVCALECEALRALLQERGAQCLVLDCRSFFSFNAAHIRGSCNVRLSTIVRRRAKGALALEHVVPNEELRARLRQGLFHTVVLLDERSADLEVPKRDSTMLLALGTLCREARGARICFLKGEWPRGSRGGRGGAGPGRPARPAHPAPLSPLCPRRRLRSLRVRLLRALHQAGRPRRAQPAPERQPRARQRRLGLQLLRDAALRPGERRGQRAEPPRPAGSAAQRSGRCRGAPAVSDRGSCSLLQGGPVEILPFLYLGSAYHASRKDMLDALGITALINVSANCPNHFEGHYQYKSIPVEDNHKADISSWFNEAIDFIGKWSSLCNPRFLWVNVPWGFSGMVFPNKSSTSDWGIAFHWEDKFGDHFHQFNSPHRHNLSFVKLLEILIQEALVLQKRVNLSGSVLT